MRAIIAVAIFLSPGAAVSCGNHVAESCELCGHHTMCNGDCAWGNGTCVFRGVYNGGRECGACQEPCDWCGPNMTAKCAEQDDGHGRVCLPQKQCRCAHGTPVAHAHCEDVEWCATCDDDRGYYLPLDMGTRCQLKECTCYGGQPVGAVNCPRHMVDRCASCNASDGFEFSEDGLTCRQKACACQHGEAAHAANCTTHQDAQCERCHSGYYLAGKRCELKRCTCEHGTPSGAADCSAHGAEQCSTCRVGYHLTGRRCELKRCTCDHGTPSGATKCSANGAEQCDVCQPGYQLSGQQCELKRCLCNHGKAAGATNCSAHGAEQCDACHSGYELSGQRCELKQCLCEYGTPAGATSCSAHGEEQCGACHSGYHLTDRKCEVNVCSCHHGDPVKSSACMTHNRQQCDACQSGYHLVNQLCEVKTCTCAHGGQGASGADCPIHGTLWCSSCNDGHTFWTATGQCRRYYTLYCGIRRNVTQETEEQLQDIVANAVSHYFSYPRQHISVAASPLAEGRTTMEAKQDEQLSSDDTYHEAKLLSAQVDQPHQGSYDGEYRIEIQGISDEPHYNAIADKAKSPAFSEELAALMHPIAMLRAGSGPTASNITVAAPKKSPSSSEAVQDTVNVSLLPILLIVIIVCFALWLYRSGSLMRLVRSSAAVVDDEMALDSPQCRTMARAWEITPRTKTPSGSSDDTEMGL